MVWIMLFHSGQISRPGGHLTYEVCFSLNLSFVQIVYPGGHRRLNSAFHSIQIVDPGGHPLYKFFFSKLRICTDNVDSGRAPSHQ